MASTVMLGVCTRCDGDGSSGSGRSGSGLKYELKVTEGKSRK